MAIRPFIVTQATAFSDQPDAAGEQLIFRSDDAADLSPLTLTAAGNVASVPASEAKDLSALSGRIEQQTTAAFQTLTAVKLDGAPSGSVSVRGQGTKASGSIALPSGGPVADDTLNLGVLAFEKAYTFKAGARWTILCLAFAGISQGDYFDIVFGGVTNRFWYDKDAAGTGAPANPGTLNEVDITTGMTADQVASATQAKIDLLANAIATVLTDTVTVTLEILGTMTVTDGAAPTGFTLTSTVTGTATNGDGTVVIGSDRFQTIRNLAHAINAGTGSGTLYGSATTANAYAQAYSDSGFSTGTFNGTSHSTAYVRDRLACARALGWGLSSSDSDMSLVAPSGGVDGSLLATLDSTSTQVSLPMNFNNPALSAVLDGGVGLLLAATTPTTDAVYVGGQVSTLRLKAANYTNPVTVDIEFSDDGVNWTSAGVTLDALDNNDQLIAMWSAEYFRLVFSVNANTTDVALHAILCTP